MGNGRSGLSKGSFKSTGGFTSREVKRFQKLKSDAAASYIRNMPELSREDAYNLGLNYGQGFQTLVHNLNLHGKPIVLTDADFDKQAQTEALDGIIIYRGVGSAHSVESTMFSNYTYIGDGIHGDGLYFSTDLNTADDYSGYTGNIMTAYIDKTLARPITEDRLRSMFSRESHEFKDAFRRKHYEANSAIAMYAIYKGYNVIHVPGGNGGSHYSIKSLGKDFGEDYYVPLIRSILVIREHTKRRK